MFDRVLNTPLDFCNFYEKKNWRQIVTKALLNHAIVHQTNIFSKSTIETLEKGVKFVQS